MIQLGLEGIAEAVAGDNTVARAVSAAVGSIVSSAITYPFLAAVLTILYFDQRVRKEGFDLQLQAEGFGITRDPDAPLPAPLIGDEVYTPEQRAAAPYWPPPPGWTPPPAEPQPSEWASSSGWSAPSPDESPPTDPLPARRRRAPDRPAGRTPSDDAALAVRTPPWADRQRDGGQEGRRRGRQGPRGLAPTRSAPRPRGPVTRARVAGAAVEPSRGARLAAARGAARAPGRCAPLAASPRSCSLALLFAAAPARASDVSAAEFRSLAAAAVDDPAALAAAARRRHGRRAPGRRRRGACGARAARRSTRGCGSSRATTRSCPATVTRGRTRARSSPSAASRRPTCPARSAGSSAGCAIACRTSAGSTTCCPAGGRSCGSCSRRSWPRLAWFVARRFLTTRVRASAAEQQALAAARDEDPRALDRRADAAEAAGDLEAALRLRFRAGLLRLDARGAIEFRPSISTFEVRRTLHDDDFDALAATFDDVVYGGRPPAPDDLAAARERWPRVVKGSTPQQRPPRERPANGRLRGAANKGSDPLGRRRVMPRDGRVRLALGIAVCLVGFAVVLAIVDRLTPEPKGPPSSSYATTPQGLAAYASVLQRNGHPVRRLRTRIADEAPPTDQTLVVLDPDVMEPEEARAIGEWVRSGGNLVAGGTGEAAWLDEVLDDPPALGGRRRPAAAHARPRGDDHRRRRGRLRRRRLARARAARCR